MAVKRKRQSSVRRATAPGRAHAVRPVRAAQRRGTPSGAVQPAHAESPLPRWNANPDDVQRSVVQLVLSLVEFLRELMERQAVRRFEGGTLTPEETEAVGQALMQLERTVHDLAARFGIDRGDLNLDLGPLGTLR